MNVVYNSDYLAYDFGPQHPFTPTRWQALADLLWTIDLPVAWSDPVAIDESSLRAVHRPRFIEAVKAASEGQLFAMSGHFGLGTPDVPTFLGMHQASLGLCAGAVSAGRVVKSGASRRALQLAGGLHHAMPSAASGFCVYNDLGVLIWDLVQQGMKVAYIDVDVHHGDGVQRMFYSDPNVLTVSLHESGQYLFPGTGFIDELGEGEAIGPSINVPLYPGTRDTSYLESFDAIVPDVVNRFGPDIIVVQAGADAHALDPLADLALTTRGYRVLFDRILSLSDVLCDGRLVVTLGGGYFFDATLRVWTILACMLAGVEPPVRFPEGWRRKWQPAASGSIQEMIDDDFTVEARASTDRTADTNRTTVTELKDRLAAVV
ncbi:MAG TPA: acetoin utilization protein AcuC [Rhodothermales bacterium]|nr:acetoin utilization protein AcuC [Rhodothermales bacterium]